MCPQSNENSGDANDMHFEDFSPNLTLAIRKGQLRADLLLSERSCRSRPPPKQNGRKATAGLKRSGGPFAGGSGVAVWLNEFQTDNGTRYARSITFAPRRFRDRKTDEWRDGASRPVDLPTLFLAIEAAHDYSQATALPGDQEEVDALNEGETPPDLTNPILKDLCRSQNPPHRRGIFSANRWVPLADAKPRGSALLAKPGGFAYKLGNGMRPIGVADRRLDVVPRARLPSHHTNLFKVR